MTVGMSVFYLCALSCCRVPGLVLEPGCLLGFGFPIWRQDLETQVERGLRGGRVFLGSPAGCFATGYWPHA